MNRSLLILVLTSSTILFTSCRASPVSCPPAAVLDEGYVDSLPPSAPIQFPLDDYQVTGVFKGTNEPGSGIFENKIHGAEDIIKPAGTPVYAMADGRISYSGPRDGYGWLVVIDHSQLHVYSLYGHLSPSQWAKGIGQVKKGEMIGYLGHGYENGYNDEQGYITPHLHFMIRVGQRSDYPRKGDGRWMAGWTYACPESHGWLQPSKFILDYATQGEAYLSEIKALAEIHTSRIRPAYYILALCGLALAWHTLSLWRIRSISVHLGDIGSPICKTINPWKVASSYKNLMIQVNGKPDGLYYQYLLSTFLIQISVSLTAILLINF